MRTLIVYESMFGNTRAVAEAIGDGLASHDEVRVVPVADATGELADWAEVLVVGAPTHGHGMTTPQSREGARHQAAKPDGSVHMDAHAGPGIRDWLERLEPGRGKPAFAFDTRIKAPALLTGRASSGISRLLRQRGFEMRTEPESFLVDLGNHLVEGELDRAKEWGTQLAA